MYTCGVTSKRRLVLIDIENVVGGGVCMPSQVHAAQAAISSAIGACVGDLIVVSCGRFSVGVVGFEWAGPHRLVFREGANGADLEILDILESERVSERFTDLVLVSGDGIFADIVSLLGLSTEVTVVARERACARRLRMAAKHVLHLDYDTNEFTEAA
jgi:hypothetical protein